jgi:porphobilinogen synthase
VTARRLPVPVVRPRRLRSTASLRSLVRETTIQTSDFIYPMFATAEPDPVRREIGSMPGVFQHSIDELRSAVDLVVDAGVLAIILFGLPETKDEQASEAYAERGIVQRAVRALKSDHPELTVITDVCVDEYTSHGHCGIVRGGEVVNDETLDLLARVAVSHAAAGADIVAPSDMMDGRVAAIRTALDDNDFENTPILSYAVKYASAMYGPFREAADSAPKFGDRRSYQMDPANRREAMKEVDLDIAEGADMVMVKPALSYLDIVRDVRERVNVPVAAYNVSGEYAMVKAAARNGWIDERAAVLEILTSIKRAGADLILTYHAVDAAGWLAS